MALNWAESAALSGVEKLMHESRLSIQSLEANSFWFPMILLEPPFSLSDRLGERRCGTRWSEHCTFKGSVWLTDSSKQRLWQKGVPLT
jgi:hypothetical protein